MGGSRDRWIRSRLGRDGGDSRGRAERGAGPLSRTGERACRGCLDQRRLPSRPSQHDRQRP
ncbi:hypothetical protein CIW48_24920 [Methylobacterium sp. P1-11]|nr:hypothetical protein CIW48_24920 [Methylobacterium sp. P1-11]